jgi:hypothetical protein
VCGAPLIIFHQKIFSQNQTTNSTQQKAYEQKNNQPKRQANDEPALPAGAD